MTEEEWYNHLERKYSVWNYPRDMEGGDRLAASLEEFIEMLRLSDPEFITSREWALHELYCTKAFVWREGALVTDGPGSNRMRNALEAVRTGGQAGFADELRSLHEYQERVQPPFSECWTNPSESIKAKRDPKLKKVCFRPLMDSSPLLNVPTEAKAEWLKGARETCDMIIAKDKNQFNVCRARDALAHVLWIHGRDRTGQDGEFY